MSFHAGSVLIVYVFFFFAKINSDNPCLFTAVPCLNGGSCIIQVKGFRCTCLEQFTGLYCGTYIAGKILYTVSQLNMPCKKVFCIHLLYFFLLLITLHRSCLIIFPKRLNILGSRLGFLYPRHIQPSFPFGSLSF